MIEAEGQVPGPEPDGNQVTGDMPQQSRLLRRQRVWMGIGFFGLFGTALYSIGGAFVFDHLTGTAADNAVISLFVLAGVTVAALVLIRVETLRWHRNRGSSDTWPPPYLNRQVSTKQGTKSMAVAILLPLALGSVVYVPRQVDALAYLAGAGQTATFYPGDSNQVCGRFGCSTVTEGTLTADGTGPEFTWPADTGVNPFKVRMPVWAWGTGHQLMADDGTAVHGTFIGVFLDLIAALVIYVFVSAAQSVRRKRRRTHPALGAIT
jgi:hypothetical protein